MLRTAAAALLLATASGCTDPPIFQTTNAPGGPAGVLDGTVTYVGPLPCTEDGHVLGAAALLVFDTTLLPPPEGLGTTAASFSAIGGDELFGGVTDRLTYNADGSEWCPPAGTPEVTVSGTWVAGPIPGGVYEIRGFYDLNGDFDPAFSIANEPTAGDIGGGALDNAAAAAAGAAPIYRQVALGDPNADGTRTIPPEGARVGGIAVSLGLPLPLNRPVFHITAVQDPDNPKPDLSNPTMASDFQIATFDQTDTTDTMNSFFALELGAGVAPAEVDKATQSPFFLPGSDATITYSRYDANGDGKIDANDHVPQSTLLPALSPIAVATQLVPGNPLVNQSTPAAVLQGITIFTNLIDTVTFPTTPMASKTAFIALPPAVLCIDPTAPPTQHAVLVVTHENDLHMHPLLADPGGVTATLAAQFGRPVDLVYACLPQGQYGVTLVYPTSQTWSIPNEAGVCAPSETPGDGTCGTRPELASQAVSITIGPPKDASYCTAHPVPAACIPSSQ